MFVLANLFPGLILLLYGLFIRIRPPKYKPAHLWLLPGLRTSTALKSEAVWKDIFKYSSSLMIFSGLFSIVFGFASYFMVNFVPGLILTLVLAAMMFLWTVLSTDRYMKKNFDIDGNRKHADK